MIKKYIFMALGFISLGIAYIGFVTPGIPFSIFLVFSAYCFAKSNKKMERWLYNHPWFGKFFDQLDTKKSISFERQICYGACDVFHINFYLVLYRKYQGSVVVRNLYGIGGNLGMAFSKHSGRA